MDERHSGREDDAAIRDVVESWTAAVRGRDFEGILQNHSSDIVMFDVPPPLQSRGIEAYRKTWDVFLSWSSAPVHFDPTELNITAGKDVAFAVATMSNPGRSSPGTLGVFSRTANSLRIAYSPLHGTIQINFSFCCAAV